MLTYSWGGLEAEGRKFDNPHLPADGRISILRGHQRPKTRWFLEEINVSADFATAFGYRPISMSYIVISADSEDSKGFSHAQIRNLIVSQPPSMVPERE